MNYVNVPGLVLYLKAVSGMLISQRMRELTVMPLDKKKKNSLFYF